MSETPLSYCGDQLRRYDRERFLTALFAPPDRREALFALYAFNLEIAKIRETVSEVLIGHIRLQWWRETIDEIYQGVPVRRYEVAEALAAAILRHALPREPFDRLIDARMADLDEDPPPTLAALETYVDDTAGVIVALACRVLEPHAPAHEAVALSVGRAQGLAGALRGMARRAQLSRVDMPLDLMQRHAVRTRDILDLRRSEGLQTLARDIAQRAESLLTEARGAAGSLPRTLLPALLAAHTAERHLKALKRVAYDPFDPSLGRPDGLLSLSLTVSAWRGRW